jgi:hypothetical protein
LKGDKPVNPQTVKQKLKRKFSMSFKNILFTMALAIFIFSACRKQPSSINLEQVNSPKAQHILAPGMFSIGIINNGLVYVYYLDENYSWSLDRNSQFVIPDKNQGILGMGMGTIAVRHKDKLYFYNMDSALNWIENYELVMPLPSNYTRISSMRMPWQRGAIAIEDQQGVIRFYYLDENMVWQIDETANFTVPTGIENYIMMGGMEIAVVSDNKLGIYQLNHSGKWIFRDDMVLALPAGTEAVLSFEPGLIAVLTHDNTILFFEPDYENSSWIYDETMDFQIP